MSCYLRANNIEAAENVFAEIPEEWSGGGYSLFSLPIGVEWTPYLEEVLNQFCLPSTNEKTRAKAHGIRGVYSFEYKNPTSKSELTRIKKDLNIALNVYERSVNFHQTLASILGGLNDWLGANLHFIKARLYAGKEIYNSLESLDRLYNEKAKFNKFIIEVEKIIDSDQYRWKDRFAQSFLASIIGFLHSKNEYSIVLRIVSHFTFVQQNGAKILFEVAYAYVQKGDKKRGIQYYRAALRDTVENAAILNNLALLEEEFGNLGEAEKLFVRAVELDNDKAKTNLENLRNKTRKIEEQNRALTKAYDLYKQEDQRIRRGIARLFGERTTDDLILCKPEHAGNIFKISDDEADDLIQELIRKKYFEVVTEHGLAFDGYILKTNPIIVQLLEKETEAASEEARAEKFAVELSSNSLKEKYEFDDNLTKQLSKLTSAELSAMLERDLREVVFALATQSNKSALVLCGSIIEAILLDQLNARHASAIKSLETILERDGKKLRSDDKRIENWTLDRMLNVARVENLISENLYYWGHGIRGFRNLVHPAAEQRKIIDVSKENAEIAWSVVKRLLKELT